MWWICGWPRMGSLWNSSHLQDEVKPMCVLYETRSFFAFVNMLQGSYGYKSIEFLESLQCCPIFVLCIHRFNGCWWVGDLFLFEYICMWELRQVATHQDFLSNLGSGNETMVTPPGVYVLFVSCITCKHWVVSADQYPSFLAPSPSFSFCVENM